MEESLYTIGGKSVYGYYWLVRGSDLVSTFISYLPGMSTLNSIGMKICGFEEIDSSSAKGLLGILHNIKNSDAGSITLDVLSTLEKLSDVGKLSKILNIGGKIIGKAANAIGKGFNICDTLKFFTDAGYVSDQILNWTPIEECLYATTREGVEQKYLYASMTIKKLISEGKITYKTDWLGNVSYVDYNSSDINDMFIVK